MSKFSNMLHPTKAQYIYIYIYIYIYRPSSFVPRRNYSTHAHTQIHTNTYTHKHACKPHLSARDGRDGLSTCSVCKVTVSMKNSVCLEHLGIEVCLASSGVIFQDVVNYTSLKPALAASCLIRLYTLLTWADFVLSFPGIMGC